MTRKSQHVRASDIHGFSRLAIDATLGLTNLVETMHHNISSAPGVLGTSTQQPMKGISGLAYRIIRPLAIYMRLRRDGKPLDPRTHHLIGARELGLMKPSAFLVNTARDPIVDEKALAPRPRAPTAARLAPAVHTPGPAPGRSPH